MTNTCPECYGTKRFLAPKTVECVECKGTGVVGGQQCEVCDGLGKKLEMVEVECPFCNLRN